MDAEAAKPILHALDAHLRALQARGISYLPAAKPIVAPAPVSDLPSLSNAPETLEAISLDLGSDCARCKLAGLGRRQVVFGVGNPHARIMFVGEGPGADEDQQGEPFVGKAGQLLTRIIEAMGLARSDVYIANVVKCRPPDNRNPEPDEIEACRPFLERQIDAVRPAIIVGLGKFAAQLLANSTTPITRLRGQWKDYRGIKLMPTLHPAYVLRNPEEGRKMVWEDMLKVIDAYNDDLPAGMPRLSPKQKR